MGSITTPQYLLIVLVGPFLISWYMAFAAATVLTFLLLSPLVWFGYSRMHTHIAHILADFEISSRKLFDHELTAHCEESLWVQMYRGNESWAGWHYKFSGDKVPPAETVILDFVTIMSLAARKGRLGCVKVFAKKSIQFIPGIGWGMYFLNFPFLSRDWARDISKINSVFKRLKESDLPFWIVSHLEGTRMSEEKYKASRAFSKAHGKPLLNHCLHPRTKGFIATVRGLRDRVDAIYDVTLAYGDPISDPRSRLVPPSTLGLVLSKFIVSPIDVHVHVRRFPIEEVPHDPSALTTWIENVWLEKDALLDHFYRSGAFPSPVREPLRHRWISLFPPPSETQRLRSKKGREGAKAEKQEKAE